MRAIHIVPLESAAFLAEVAWFFARIERGSHLVIKRALDHFQVDGVEQDPLCIFLGRHTHDAVVRVAKRLGDRPVYRDAASRACEPLGFFHLNTLLLDRGLGR